MTTSQCPRCAARRPDNFRWCRKCGLDFHNPPKAASPAPPVATPPTRAHEPTTFRYDKPGARVAIFADRLELTTGVLWNKRTHAIPLKAIVGVSVVGLGGSTLIVQTAGRPYEVAVGIGAASPLRERILAAMRDEARA